jgi:DNA-directed RNA polymerase specialized sigma24 family protein
MRLIYGPGVDPADAMFRKALREEQAADLRQLKPRERRDLLLHAAGYRYDEIAEMTGSTYTAVNRRLTEGRAHLRDLARQRDATGKTS